MTEKRFEKRLNKGNIKFNTLNPVWDNLKEDALNVFEMSDLLNELHNEKELYKMLWEQMSYYFREEVTLKDLDHKDFRALQRLSKGLVD